MDGAQHAREGEGRLALVRAHGRDPISYSTLQPGLSYFDCSYGYVAYRSALGFDLTLGPPVCAAEDRPALLERFLRARRRPIFFYLQAEDARAAAQLAGARFHSSGMGVDKVLLLREGTPVQERVRGALKKADRAGLRLEEVRPGTLGPAERARLAEITADYLRRSSVPVEMRFLNRPLAQDDAGGARTFLLRQGRDGAAFGYAVLDPYFDGGAPRGYLLNLIRFEKTRLWGVYYSAVARLAELLRGEGIGELSLGFCPLVEVDTRPGSPWLTAQLGWMERRLSGIDYLARLKELKDAFAGATVQRYLLSPTRLAAPALLVLLRACGVPLGGILRRSLAAFRPWAAAGSPAPGPGSPASPSARPAAP